MSGMIEKVDIHNFKCHKDLEIELKKLNLFTGENASGKSSVIQALLLLLGTKTTSNVGGVNLGKPFSLLSTDADTDIISIAIEVIEDESKKYIFKEELTPPEDYSHQMSFIYSGKTNQENARDIIRIKKAIRFFYINAERTPPQLTWSLPEIYTYYVGSHGQYTTFLINQMNLPTEKRKIDNSTVNPNNIQFSKLCDFYLGKIIHLEDIHINSSINEDYGMSSISYDNYDVKSVPTATGFGITYVLPIIVQGLISTMFDNSVLVIENPEAHLHPYSQSQIGQFLSLIASAGVQVIIETHSDHVLDGCRLFAVKDKNGFNEKMSIFYFQHQKKPIHISVSSNGELSSWPVGFFDQEANDLREIMQNRKK